MRAVFRRRKVKPKKEMSNILSDRNLDFLVNISNNLQTSQPTDPVDLFEYSNVVIALTAATLKLEKEYNELLTEVRPVQCDHDTAGIYRTGYDAGYAKGWTNCAVNFWATIKETTWNLRNKFNPDGEKK